MIRIWIKSSLRVLSSTLVDMFYHVHPRTNIFYKHMETLRFFSWVFNSFSLSCGLQMTMIVMCVCDSSKVSHEFVLSTSWSCEPSCSGVNCAMISATSSHQKISCVDFCFDCQLACCKAKNPKIKKKKENHKCPKNKVIFLVCNFQAKHNGVEFCNFPKLNEIDCWFVAKAKNCRKTKSTNSDAKWRCFSVFCSVSLATKRKSAPHRFHLLNFCFFIQAAGKLTNFVSTSTLPQAAGKATSFVSTLSLHAKRQQLTGCMWSQASSVESRHLSNDNLIFQHCIALHAAFEKSWTFGWPSWQHCCQSQKPFCQKSTSKLTSMFPGKICCTKLAKLICSRQTWLCQNRFVLERSQIWLQIWFCGFCQKVDHHDRSTGCWALGTLLCVGQSSVSIHAEVRLNHSSSRHGKKSWQLTGRTVHLHRLSRRMMFVSSWSLFGWNQFILIKRIMTFLFSGVSLPRSEKERARERAISRSFKSMASKNDGTRQILSVFAVGYYQQRVFIKNNGETVADNKSSPRFHHCRQSSLNTVCVIL